jgi:peptidoglycan/LPS O-acetylase OafA/YrhL
MAGAIAGVAIVFALLFAPGPDRLSLAPVLRMYFGFAPFVAVLLFCCARYRTFISAALSRPWMILCGEASYSIYLLHIGIVQYVQVYGQTAGIPPAPYDVWGVLHALVSMVLVAMTVVGLSLVAYRLIETPARAMLRRLRILGPSRMTSLILPPPLPEAGISPDP